MMREFAAPFNVNALGQFDLGSHHALGFIDKTHDVAAAYDAFTAVPTWRGNVPSSA